MTKILQRFAPIRVRCEATNQPHLAADRTTRPLATVRQHGVHSPFFVAKFEMLEKEIPLLAPLHSRARHSNPSALHRSNESLPAMRFDLAERTRAKQ